MTGKSDFFLLFFLGRTGQSDHCEAQKHEFGVELSKIHYLRHEKSAKVTLESPIMCQNLEKKLVPHFGLAFLDSDFWGPEKAQKAPKSGLLGPQLDHQRPVPGAQKCAERLWGSKYDPMDPF